MEKNNKCDICGKELTPIIEGHSLTLTCSEHGGRIATSYFSEMELDSTNYEIYLQPSNVVNKQNIQVVSEIANTNYLNSKKMLESKSAVLIYKVTDAPARALSKPEEIIKAARRLKDFSIDFAIVPEFKYEI